MLEEELLDLNMPERCLLQLYSEKLRATQAPTLALLLSAWMLNSEWTLGTKYDTLPGKHTRLHCGNHTAKAIVPNLCRLCCRASKGTQLGTFRVQLGRWLKQIYTDKESQGVGEHTHEERWTNGLHLWCMEPLSLGATADEVGWPIAEGLEGVLTRQGAGAHIACVLLQRLTHACICSQTKWEYASTCTK